MPTVADVLKKCCDDARVTFKPVRKAHGDCKQLVYGSGGPGGICCALSLLWLSRYFKGDRESDQFGGSSFGELVTSLEDQPGLIQQVQNFFGSLLANAPPEETKGQKLAGQLRTIQEREITRGEAIRQATARLSDKTLSEDERIEHFNTVTQVTGYKALYRKSMASLGVANVTFVDDHATKTNFYSLCDRIRPYQSAINFMTGQSGASLIKFESHYVAVISDIPRKKYKFLDVNGGQAITDDPTGFENFLSAYFEGQVIDEYTRAHKTMQVTMALIPNQ
jgi:hypothetical protein